MTCKILIGAFVLLYALALAVFFTGTYGWFGQDKDPLSGIFLLLLGLPWALIEFPARYNGYFAALSPVLNIFVLWMICWVVSGRLWRKF